MKKITVHYDTEIQDGNGKWSQCEDCMELDAADYMAEMLAGEYWKETAAYRIVVKLIKMAERLKGRFYVGIRKIEVNCDEE